MVIFYMTLCSTERLEEFDMKKYYLLLVMLLTVFSCKQFIAEEAATGNYTNGEAQPVIDTSRFMAIADLQNQLHGIAENKTPSVVFIGTEKTVSQQYMDPFDFFFNEPFNNRNKNRQKERSFKQTGLGSGVIYRQKGNEYYIITNNHVIEGADSIRVTVDQKEFYKASVMGADPAIDIAILKIETKNKLVVAQFGDSDILQVGDFVIAIGNPYGLYGSMTFGIISAIGRSDIMNDRPNLTNFIQTDAAINPGNSGGPLININGEVIGINTLIYSQSGGNVGIGFSIPVNIVRNAAEQIIEKGKVDHGYLGVYFEELAEESIKTLGLKKVKFGMLVNRVFADSPAEKAGIKAGDILIKLDGKQLRKSSDLTIGIGSKSPGDLVKMTMIRDGKEIDIDVTLGNRDDMETAEANDTKTFEDYGFELADLDASSRERYGIASTINGALVVDVQKGSQAEENGIEEGDVIYKINSKRVTSADDVGKIVSKADNDSNYFFIVREGREFIVTM
jgi:serine protease Do